MESFDNIWHRAAQRKGGEAILKQLLPSVPSRASVASLPDAFFLSQMTKTIFKSGFVWRVIEKKWPDFEAAFRGFEPADLFMLREEDWEAYAQDTRIVRNMTKVYATKHNLNFVQDMADAHGSFGQWISQWPHEDPVGLLIYLKKHGSRLGGMSGQYFLAGVGIDTFMLSQDVVHALKLAGLEVADNPTSQRDLKKIQAQYNEWHQSTGLSFREINRTLAFSTGDNVVGVR